MPEQVGEAALLFDPESDEEVSRAMLDLYSNEELRSSLIEKGYQQVALYSQDAFNRRFRDTLSDLE